MHRGPHHGEERRQCLRSADYLSTLLSCYTTLIFPPRPLPKVHGLPPNFLPSFLSPSQILDHKRLRCTACPGAEGAVITAYSAYHTDAVRKHFLRHHEV